MIAVQSIWARVAMTLSTLAALGATGCASAAPEHTANDGGPGYRPPADDDKEYILGPEISHSRGVEGGIVLLWPRVVPMAQTAAMRGPAKALQDRLRSMLEQHFPGRPIDVRPEPERVCPKTGCLATSVGVLIGVREGESCVAVVIVSPPGRSDQLLMPWAGLVTTKLQVPFREPPESSMQIQEMVPCDKLTEVTLEREDRVKEALRVAE